MIARSHLLLTATATLLVAGAIPAHAVPCQTSGTYWRLIDGRKCWTDKHYPKSMLSWQRSKGNAASPGSLQSAKRGARHRMIVRSYHRNTTQVPQPSPLPQDRPPSRDPDPLRAQLEARANALRGSLDAPRPVRTVLVNPYDPKEPETGGDEAGPVPFPRPRPKPQGEPSRYLRLVPLLLAGLMIGSVCTNSRG